MRMVEAPGKARRFPPGPVDGQHLRDLGLSQGECNRDNRVNPFPQQEVLKDALAAHGALVMLYSVRS